MSSTSTSKPNFVPVESIITFAFIGAVVLVGLIARCLASNHSTIRSVEDLMIYREAPRPAPVPKPRPASVEQQFHSQSDSQDLKKSTEDPVRIQRGPKNL
jgi:hypothetical protein